MTITRHKIAAVVSVDHYQAGATLYSSAWTSAPPPGWSATPPATFTMQHRNPAAPTSGYQPVVSYAAGGDFRRQFTEVPANSYYRVTFKVGKPAGPQGPYTLRLIAADIGEVTASVPMAVAAEISVDAFNGGPAGNRGMVKLELWNAANTARASGLINISQVTVQALTRQQYLELHPESAAVTMDESWSPYVQATLVCPIPDATALADLDPRKPRRVLVTMSQAGASTLYVKDFIATVPLLESGDFEYDLTGWAAIGSTTTRTRDTTTFHDGAASMRIAWGAAGSFSGTAQVLGRLVIGQVYTVTSWHYVSPGGEPVSMAINGMGFGVATTLTGVWEQLTYSFTATAAQHTLSIQQLSVGTPYTSWLDTVVVDGVHGHATAADISRVTVNRLASYFTDLFSDSLLQPDDPTDPAGLAVNRSLNLGLRSRALDYVAGTMTLVLTSDEMLAQDYARILTAVGQPDAGQPNPPPTTDLRTLVAWGINLIGGSLDGASTTAPIASADIDWVQGMSIWDLLSPFVDAAGLRLRCDESRIWHLELPPTGSAGSVTINALTALDDVLSRENWGDSVVQENTWTNSADQDITTYGGAATVAGGTYTKTVVVQKRSKSKASNAGAASLLGRVNTRGRMVSLSAVNNYQVTPGLLAYISTPATVINPVLVSGVTWNWPEDEMTVSTRDVPL